MTRQSNSCKGDSSLLRNVYTSSETLRASSSKDTGAVALAMKWTGRKPYHSPPLSDEVKNKSSYKSTTTVYLNGKHRDKFIFTCLYLLSIPRHSEWCFFFSRFLTILPMRVVRPAHPTVFDFSIPKIFCDQCNYEALLDFSSRSVLQFLNY